VDDADLGRPKLAGNGPSQTLATPGFILSLVQEVKEKLRLLKEYF